MTRSRILLFAASLLLPSICAAQSLADVARAEEERRKAVAKPAKVYTNSDLHHDASRTTPAPPPATQPASGPAASSNTSPSAPKPASDEPAKDQAYWSARMGAARQQLERSRMFADALQSRINALSADFVNRDDPVQRAQISQDRQKALAELERVQGEIAEHTKAITDIEEEARKAGVPPGWLR